MSDTISLEGLNKAAVLAALFNGSKPQGLGFLQYDPTPMTTEQAEERFGNDPGYFDYLDGRVMKVDLSGDELRISGYDRDNGHGAAARIINELRSSNNVVSQETVLTQRENTIKSAQNVFDNIGEQTVAKEHGDVLEVNIGLAGIADTLLPTIVDILNDDE